MLNTINTWIWRGLWGVQWMVLSHGMKINRDRLIKDNVCPYSPKTSETAIKGKKDWLYKSLFNTYLNRGWMGTGAQRNRMLNTSLRMLNIKKYRLTFNWQSNSSTLSSRRSTFWLFHQPPVSSSLFLMSKSLHSSWTWHGSHWQEDSSAFTDVCFKTVMHCITWNSCNECWLMSE